MNDTEPASEVATNMSAHGDAQSDMAVEGAEHSVPAPSPNLLAMVERIALDPRADVDKAQAMVALYERMQAAQALREYSEAMNRAQAEIAPVARTVQHSEVKSHWYAKLEHVDAAIRPIYIKHGFSLSDNTVPPLQPGFIRLECLCSHVGGHRERFYREGPPDNIGPKGGPTKTLLHGVGSADTFLRRYLHCGIFNVVFEGLDDDGNGGPISEEEVDQIVKGLEDGKVNKGRFLKYMRLPSTMEDIIATIPKSDLGKALLAIEELVKRQTENHP